MDLNHIVVAMKADKIAKVQCLTCEKEHLYRAPKGLKAPKKASAPKVDHSASHSIELEWEKLMHSHKDVALKPYGLKKAFDLGDKIQHPTFGDGIIGKLIYPNKIEVVFRHDVKILIHTP